MSFSWVDGRKLSAVTKGTDSISYTYDASGLRTSKTVNGTTIEYYRLGDVLLAQRSGDEYIIFLYDENGAPYGMLLKNGTSESYYYYVYNLQGDIIRLIDSNGISVAEYSYNEWGKIISVTDGSGNDVTENAEHIANINPLRYRGYYYDSETGFYYLQSRYYDPIVQRFINADGLITQESIFGNNLFAYCLNNPINRADPYGDCSFNSCPCPRPGGSVGYGSRTSNDISFDDFKNSDGSYSLYDNKRNDPDNIFHEQILTVEANASYDIFNEGLSFDASITLMTGGWEWEHVDLSLFNIGSAEIGLGISDEFIGAQAIAAIWDPSISFKIKNFTIEISFYVGAIGAEFFYDDGKFKIGGAGPFGASLLVY